MWSVQDIYCTAINEYHTKKSSLPVITCHWMISSWCFKGSYQLCCKTHWLPNNTASHTRILETSATCYMSLKPMNMLPFDNIVATSVSSKDHPVPTTQHNSNTTHCAYSRHNLTANGMATCRIRLIYTGHQLRILSQQPTFLSPNWHSLFCHCLSLSLTSYHVSVHMYRYIMVADCLRNDNGQNQN